MRIIKGNFNYTVVKRLSDTLIWPVSAGIFTLAHLFPPEVDTQVTELLRGWEAERLDTILTGDSTGTALFITSGGGILNEEQMTTALEQLRRIATRNPHKRFDVVLTILPEPNTFLPDNVNLWRVE